MLIAVVGGTGTLGRAAVDELARRGHEVRSLSRNPLPTPGAATHHRVDLVNGTGLAQALAGAEAVLDASNARRLRDTGRLLLGGTRLLLAAEARAGVSHHVLISVVGIEQVPFSYYRAKLAQERLVTEGARGSSIVRATQVHDLLDRLLAGCARLGMRPRSRAPLQPVDARQVAITLADALELGPSTEHRPVAGPDVLSITEVGRLWSRATGRRRVPLTLPLAGRAGRALRHGRLLGPPQATPGPLTFAGWLDERYAGRPIGVTDRTAV